MVKDLFPHQPLPSPPPWDAKMQRYPAGMELVLMIIYSHGRAMHHIPLQKSVNGQVCPMHARGMRYVPISWQESYINGLPISYSGIANISKSYI